MPALDPGFRPALKPTLHLPCFSFSHWMSWSCLSFSSARSKVISVVGQRPSVTTGNHLGVQLDIIFHNPSGVRRIVLVQVQESGNVSFPLWGTVSHVGKPTPCVIPVQCIVYFLFLKGSAGEVSTVPTSRLSSSTGCCTDATRTTSAGVSFVTIILFGRSVAAMSLAFSTACMPSVMRVQRYFASCTLRRRWRRTWILALTAPHTDVSSKPTKPSSAVIPGSLPNHSSKSVNASIMFLTSKFSTKSLGPSLDFVQLDVGVRQAKQADTMNQTTTRGSSCPACRPPLYHCCVPGS